MAQAIPISHQQKLAGSSTAANRWSASSSQQQQISDTINSQRQSTAIRQTTSAVATSTNDVLPSIFSSAPRVGSATLPRQNKQQDVQNSNSGIPPSTSMNDGRQLHLQSVPQTASMITQPKQQGSATERRGSRQHQNENTQPRDERSDDEDADNLKSPTTPNAAKSNTIFQAVLSSATPNGLNGATVISVGDETCVSASNLATTTSRCSPMSDKWTSFDDSEGDADEASSRHHSESEHQNLLADVDITSDGGDDTMTLTGSVVLGEDEDTSWIITPALRTYYEAQFEQLRQTILDDYKKGNLQSPAEDASHATAASPSSVAAVWGKHPLVKQFFERSTLDTTDLSQIWTLADVNMDGWLNVDEFCVAMQLIVRKVQAGLPVPTLLPVHMRPPITPPVISQNVMTGSGYWTNFENTASDQQQQPLAKPAVDLSKSDNVSNATTTDPNALSPAPALRDFTNAPPNVDHATFAHVVQPKPRRVTPELVGQQPQRENGQQTSRPSSSHHSSSAPPGVSKFVAVAVAVAVAVPTAPAPAPRPRASVTDAGTVDSKNNGQQRQQQGRPTSAKSPPESYTDFSKIQPPAAVVKGPPPKPPPRPTGVVSRHNRSVSLDLTKNVCQMQQHLVTSGDAAMFYYHNAFEHAQQTPNAVEETRNSSIVSTERKETRDAQVQTVHSESSGGRRDQLKVDEEPSAGKRLSAAPMLDMDMGDHAAPSASPDENKNETPDDSKDWMKRCERLRRTNADLEKELKKLFEIRVTLQSDLNKLEKR